MKTIQLYAWLLAGLLMAACGKDSDNEPPKPNTPFIYKTISVDGVQGKINYDEVNCEPTIELSFSLPIDRASVSNGIRLSGKGVSSVELNITFGRGDSLIIMQPTNALDGLSKYMLTVSTNLKSVSGIAMLAPLSVTITTELDRTPKFPEISDNELLDLVQQQTLRYFWDFAHPVCGMARERSSSANTVTTGGTGFGIMAIIVGVERQFISRDDAAERLLTIARFLKNDCTSYHGAFAHWINGNTGQTQPFSQKDNGADIVETSFLFQGLLAARQYFDDDNQTETEMREIITQLWEAIDWTWYQRENQQMLYWHWSPDYGWDMNHRIKGWNECLMTYVLAASSPTHPIAKSVYENGWADNGAIRNGSSFYGITLPMGTSYGGPMFFAHYSFLGLDPRNLSDQYADYWQQNVNHTLINHKYCIDNPKGYLGYSDECWGLTASDGNNGYSAHSPTNDRGVITPTAALASMPYTPEESMRALRFFYYVMGDKLWKEYGFIDSFNLTEKWYASDFLAIDQAPIVVMIENYRTGMMWNLFMEIPEIRAGLDKLGFAYGN